jgi:hypothetical protein
VPSRLVHTLLRSHSVNGILSVSQPTVYSHHPIPRTNPSATQTSKMLSITPTHRHSSFDREPITKKRMAHREFSATFHPHSPHQLQRTQPVTKNTPRNTKLTGCAEKARSATSHQPPATTAAATAPHHSHSPAPPHRESPTRPPPDRYPPCAPAALPASTGLLAGSRPIPGE